MTVEEIHGMIGTFQKNRADFYATVVPRIPHEGLRGLFGKAVGAVSGEIPNVLAVSENDNAQNDALINSLLLRDMVKKDGVGKALGRCAISFEEANAKAELIEETGLLLYEELFRLGITPHEPIAAAADENRAVLAAITRLGDAIRYRKVSLTGQGENRA